MPRVPSRASLAAQTDQALAMLADARAELSGKDGEFTAMTADATARIIAAEFPEVRELGRILVGMSGALSSLRNSLERRGVDADADALLTIAMLAGEQLDREAREGVPGNGG